MFEKKDADIKNEGNHENNVFKVKNQDEIQF